MVYLKHTSDSFHHIAALRLQRLKQVVNTQVVVKQQEK
jgi:hypothetical protein